MVIEESGENVVVVAGIVLGSCGRGGDSGGCDGRGGVMAEVQVMVEGVGVQVVNLRTVRWQYCRDEVVVPLLWSPSRSRCTVTHAVVLPFQAGYFWCRHVGKPLSCGA